MIKNIVLHGRRSGKTLAIRITRDDDLGSLKRQRDLLDRQIKNATGPQKEILIDEWEKVNAKIERLLPNDAIARDAFFGARHRERAFSNYEAWKRAVKAIDPNVIIEGNKDIANAIGIGEWDGERGVIYDARKTRDSSPAQPSKPDAKGKQDWFAGTVEYLNPGYSSHWVPQRYKLGVATEEDFKKHVRWSLGLEGATRIKFGSTVKTHDAMSVKLGNFLYKYEDGVYYMKASRGERQGPGFIEPKWQELRNPPQDVVKALGGVRDASYDAESRSELQAELDVIQRKITVKFTEMQNFRSAGKTAEANGAESALSVLYSKQTNIQTRMRKAKDATRSSWREKDHPTEVAARAHADRLEKKPEVKEITIKPRGMAWVVRWREETTTDARDNHIDAR